MGTPRAAILTALLPIFQPSGAALCPRNGIYLLSYFLAANEKAIITCWNCRPWDLCICLRDRCGGRERFLILVIEVFIVLLLTTVVFRLIQQAFIGGVQQTPGSIQSRIQFWWVQQTSGSIQSRIRFRWIWQTSSFVW